MFLFPFVQFHCPCGVCETEGLKHVMLCVAFFEAQGICGTCQYIKVGNSLKFGDKDFIVNANMSCASKMLYTTLRVADATNFI